MNTSSDEAQRTLERRALRNVRGLVDKIERDDTADRRTQRRIVGGILALALAIALALGITAYRATSGQAPVVIDPAKLPPIQPGPRA